MLIRRRLRTDIRDVGGEGRVSLCRILVRRLGWRCGLAVVVGEERLGTVGAAAVDVDAVAFLRKGKRRMSVENVMVRGGRERGVENEMNGEVSRWERREKGREVGRTSMISALSNTSGFPHHSSFNFW